MSCSYHRPSAWLPVTDPQLAQTLPCELVCGRVHCPFSDAFAACRQVRGARNSSSVNLSIQVMGTQAESRQLGAPAPTCSILRRFRSSPWLSGDESLRDNAGRPVVVAAAAGTERRQ